MEQGVGVTRVVVRYSDGRVMNFVPDARREAFSEDDMLELKKVIEQDILDGRMGRDQHAPGVLSVGAGLKSAPLGETPLPAGCVAARIYCVAVEEVLVEVDPLACQLPTSEVP